MFYRKIISSEDTTGLTDIGLAITDVQTIEKIAPTTRDRSEKIARSFLLECPTFIFDGIRSSVGLTVIEVLSQLHSWKFTFTFDCRQPGYGNRKGHRLLNFLAEHRIAITTKNGIITEAIVDDVWDELQQEML